MATTGRTMALKRLRREFAGLCSSSLALGASGSLEDNDWNEGIVAGPVSPDNFFEWDCYIMGPIDSPYEYGCFRAKLTFPIDYPMSPPSLRFTPSIWHPNIYNEGQDDGEVCISVLHAGEDQFGYERVTERWSPVQSVEKVLMSVVLMLAEPNPESPANVEAAKMFRENKEEFNRRVKQDVEKSLGL